MDIMRVVKVRGQVIGQTSLRSLFQEDGWFVRWLRDQVQSNVSDLRDDEMIEVFYGDNPMPLSWSWAQVKRESIA